MTVEKKWAITKLEVSSDTLPNTVTQVHWECTGTDGTYNGRVFKFIDLPAPLEEEFTAYEDLTEEQVLSWIHATMGEEKVSYWEQLVDIQIEKQNRPAPVEAELPWKK